MERQRKLSYVAVIVIVLISLGAMASVIVGRTNRVPNNVATLSLPPMPDVLDAEDEECHVDIVSGVRGNPVVCVVCYQTTGTQITCKETTK